MDEPASELLERIAAEKARLLKAGAIKPQRTGKSRVSSPTRFALPMGWEWACLQAVCMSITDGDHLPPPKAEQGVPFLVISNIRTQTINYRSQRWVPRSYYEALDSSRQPRPGDLLYTLVGSFGIPVEVLDTKEFCVQRHIGIIRPAQWISSPFLARVLASRFIYDQAKDCATGIAQKTVPLSGLRSLLIPLPPIAEQHRIVAKVDELMALCDRVEEARTAREHARDRLTAASLARLSAPDADEGAFRSHARFAVDALPALTAHVNQVTRLRQTILNLAVRGKLVEQDLGDEPAVALLERIAAEKARLVRAKAIRRPRHFANGGYLTPQFEVPPSWCWCRLDTVGAIIGGGTPSATDPANFAEPGKGVPWLTPADLGRYNDLYIERGSRDLSEKGLRSSSATMMPVGTVLFTSRAPIGYVAIAANPIATNQGFKSIVPYVADCSRFIALAMQVFASEIDANAPGTTFKEVSGKIVASVPLPVPPLAEQHRIVAKVDELMVLCDRLEMGLTVATTTRCNLLESLLYEALELSQHTVQSEL